MTFNRYACRSLALLLAALGTATTAEAYSLLNTNAGVLAISTKPPVSNSTYPSGEGPGSGIDGIPTTKYLNLAGPTPVGTGLIVQPFFGGTTAQSIQFTTAGDAERRDPAGYVLYGTNDPVTSVDNGDLSGAENWMQIASGDLSFPPDRETTLPAINFSNTTAYDSYRIEFTGAKGSENPADFYNGIQIGDVQLYEAPDAGGFGVFGFGDTALAYQAPQPASFSPPGQGPQNVVDYAYTYTPTSDYPDAESPSKLFDGDTGTKYLNFGGSSSGFIVTPSAPAQVQSFILTSANDALERHPTSWELFGTNDAIVSADNGFGLDENWTKIDSGEVEAPGAFFTDSPFVTVNNPSSYTSYKMLFPSLSGLDAGIMQISEASFFASTDGTGQDILEVGTPAVLAIDESRGATKNFNAASSESGYIFTPEGGASVVDGFQITTANDRSFRDPATWELYGTNDTIVSENNSTGEAETWTQIATGAFTNDEVSYGRNATGDIVPIVNSTEYTSYKILFPTLRDEVSFPNDGFQISDLQLFGSLVTPLGNPGDFNGDGIVDAADYTVWRDHNGELNEDALSGGGDGGGVTSSDYDLWVANYGTDYSGSLSVPEPGALGLAAGAWLLAVTRRRRS